MGLFDKKYCDFCGGKIGLLGNRKLEDGNMCKECASKLSPWFSERRHSTKAEIAEQLAYREENKNAVRNFTTTRSIGNYMKLLLDENHQKFIVTSASNLEKANPDVLDFSQAAGCSLEIKESRTELKTKDKEGHFISYNPPRYEYSYNFFAKIDVNSPYFDDINYSISNGYIKVGERPMTGVQSNWRVTSSFVGINNENKYYENLNLGNEIKEAVDTCRGLRGVRRLQAEPEQHLLSRHRNSRREALSHVLTAAPRQRRTQTAVVSTAEANSSESGRAAGKEPRRNCNA